MSDPGFILFLKFVANSSRCCGNTPKESRRSTRGPILSPNRRVCQVFLVAIELTVQVEPGVAA